MKAAGFRTAQQLRLREHQVFLALTIVVGILAGLAAVLFAVAIDGSTRFFFGLEPGPLRTFAVPVLISLGTGVLLAKVFPGVRGSGVPQTEAAYHLDGGVIPWRVPVGKFLTGVLCIASGHSMGREGPSVQIGGGLASAVGQALGLPPQRLKDLLAVGAAGALAAAFNTPVAAVLFALEEVIGDLNASLLGSTVVASVASVIVERSILGNEPLFHVPIYHLHHPAELIAYAALGILGGILSVAFCKGLLTARRGFLRLSPGTRILQPALGGLVIGAVLLAVPQVRGVGYEYVDQALNGGLALRTMALLCLVKMAATVVSYASGNAGGIFAPSLYIGAMAGGAVGLAVQRFAPFPAADPGAYALVGMGTLFAGIVRAPMTSVFMIFEVTQDYQILVPLMVANLLSFTISRRYQAMPVYHALLQQDGIHLPTAASRGAAAAWTAAEVMSRRVEYVSPDQTIADLWRPTVADDGHAYVVADAERIYGALTRRRLAEGMAADRGSEAVATLMNPHATHAHPDHPSDVVLQGLSSANGALPVVSRGDVSEVVGVITMENVLRFLASPRASNGHGDTARPASGYE